MDIQQGWISATFLTAFMACIVGATTDIAIPVTYDTLVYFIQQGWVTTTFLTMFMACIIGATSDIAIPNAEMMEEKRIRRHN
ncbi:hypothetical protein F2Q68_00025313 [Brassica cretica]|uniref:Uncharacterized protein n=2 Tax=Brassica cretica TaxID=69181 RepID=A0A8S9R7I7_BRACR|nr:hypothetical protein F2Q68_00025313 [Brassica cretica]KAF3559201.1 hypothetical protein F2Q69_00012932 [Brassica cretica]KAF3578016.1 hypothetical protein DY000_02031019 [Brassica cretica]